MADQPSIFEENKTSQETPENTKTESTANTPAPASTSPLEDLLKEVRNENGDPKYKTVEDALVALKHAQEYIPKVKEEKTQAEQELEALRKEVERLQNLEETVLELTQKQEQTSTNGVALDEEGIAKLVEQTLTKKELEELHRKNQAEVVRVMSEKFGDEAEKVFYSKAQELGLSVEEMNALAARSAKSVLTLLGVTETVAHQQTPKTSPTQGSVNTSAFQPNPQTYLGRETGSVLFGASTEDVKEAVKKASNLAEELAKNGLSTYDLTDPKVYNKYFK